MRTPSVATKSLSPAARRRIELAIAVAQERLLGTHVAHALDLIELVGGQVPFDEALDIYNRLLRLSEDETRIITTRALANLGERADDGPSWPERMAEADANGDDPQGGRASFFGTLRQRLRGRINEELRRWIELEAARTEVALLDTHIDNAMNFVDILQSDLPFNEAVELYLEALDVRDSIAEVVYYIALARLNSKILPPRPARRTRESAEAAASSLGAAAQERHLRVVETEGD